MAPGVPERALHRRARRPAGATPSSTPSCSPRPVPTHAALAERVLAAGKHCFVEKPLAQSVADAERAVAAARGGAARADGRAPARVPPGRREAQGDRRRRASSATSTTSTRTASTWASCARTRTRCGRSAPTTSRSCCTSPARSRSSSTRAASPTCSPAIEDVVFCYLRFPSGLAAHLHLSWLDPHKERRFTVVGSKRMATFDDMDIERKVTVYDKGFDEDSGSYGEYITRSGDIWSPAHPQPRAAADRVRALRRVRPQRPHAALGRRQRAARGARAGGRCRRGSDASRREQGAAI